MTPILFYTISLCIMLLVCIVRKRGIIGTILVISYTVIAIFSNLVVDKKIMMYSRVISSSFINYGIVLFLLISCLVFFSPFLADKKDFNACKMAVAINGNYVLFARIYIVMLINSIIIYLPRVLAVFRSGAWASNLAMFTSGDNTWAYNNVVEKIVINFTGYFVVLGLLLAFLLLQNSFYNKTGILLLILIIINEIFRDTYLSARGILIEFILLVLALYLFFYADIDKGSRRFIFVISLLIGAIVVPYIIAVTVSRFSDAAKNSVIYYLGQPPFMFGLETQEITAPMLGRFAFGVLFGDEKFPAEMGDWTHGFYMFFGWLYADWGYTGTIIIGLIWSVFLGKLIRKSVYSLPDVYSIFTCYNLLLQGTFTIGRTKCYEIISYFIIYGFLCLLTNVSFTVGGRKLIKIKE